MRADYERHASVSDKAMSNSSTTVSIFATNLFALDDSNFFPWAFVAIALGPFTWNIIARLEYRTHFLSRIFGGNRLVANYVLAFYILAVGFYRDYAFTAAVSSQPKVLELSSVAVYAAGVGCMLVGQVLVLSSFYKLGFLGTFLADYFGFLKDAPCSGFPFNVMSNPMYMGATLTFFGTALCGASAAGLVLTVWVYIVYRCALELEERFTNFVYAQREAERSAASSSKPKRSTRSRSSSRKKKE